MVLLKQSGAGSNDRPFEHGGEPPTPRVRALLQCIVSRGKTESSEIVTGLKSNVGSHAASRDLHL